MDVLSRHYYQLAGLNSDSAISHVQSQPLKLSLEFVRNLVVCPGCGAECSMQDHECERRWRRHDAMQFQTTFPARISRRSCVRCGVKANLIYVVWETLSLASGINNGVAEGFHNQIPTMTSTGRGVRPSVTSNIIEFVFAVSAINSF